MSRFDDLTFNSLMKGVYSWWNLFQVCQWLMGIGIEHHINKFIEHGVEGTSGHFNLFKVKF